MSNTATLDKPIYLDYAGTTPLDPEILEIMIPYFDSQYSNPSSFHTSGRSARHVIERARANIAHLLDADPVEIIFTGSGTESDNLALIGTAHAYQSSGNHIIISAIEHKAVAESARTLTKKGFEVSILPVDSYGLIDIDACLKLITPKTILVSVMYANNEIGTIEPIQTLAQAIQKHRGLGFFPLLHTDACQAGGLLPINAQELGVDLMTLNGSKIYGPKGIGMLYKKKTIRMNPIIVGGEQEAGIRAGTENVPSIVGFVEALMRAEKNRLNETKRLTKLRDYFVSQLKEKIPEAIFNGHPTRRLPNNVHISIPNVEGESMLLMLDNIGIEVSTGSACSAQDLQPSHVLMAIGQSPDIIHGSIRFSLGKHTTQKDLQYVVSVFPGIVKKLKRMSALTAIPHNLRV